jgi:hypothetical protein
MYSVPGVQFPKRMADEPVPTSPPPSSSPTAPATAAPASPAGASSSDFHIGEEFGTARRNLPPAGIVLICIGAVVVILGIAAILQRPKPQGAGSIDYISATDVPDQNILLAAVTLTLHNNGNKALWIRSLKAQLTTKDDKKLDDDAASGVELDRYGQAFPLLKQNALAPLLPETKILPRVEQKGTIIVSFPVSKQDFDQRKSLAVTIQFYDQPVPVVLTK